MSHIGYTKTFHTKTIRIGHEIRFYDNTTLDSLLEMLKDIPGDAEIVEVIEGSGETGSINTIKFIQEKPDANRP